MIRTLAYFLFASLPSTPGVAVDHIERMEVNTYVGVLTQTLWRDHNNRIREWRMYDQRHMPDGLGVSLWNDRGRWRLIHVRKLPVKSSVTPYDLEILEKNYWPSSSRWRFSR